MTMKKTLFAAIILLSAASCVIDEGTDKDMIRRDMNFIFNELTSMSTIYAVNTLSDLADNENDINADGFRYQSTVELPTRPDIRYLFERTGEKCWRVSASGKLMNFTMTVSTDEATKYGDWTVRPFSLRYDEGFGYSAALCTEEDIVISFSRSSYFLTRSHWELFQNGTYFLTLYINGEETDHGSRTYGSKQTATTASLQ